MGDRLQQRTKSHLSLPSSLSFAWYGTIAEPLRLQRSKQNCLRNPEQKRSYKIKIWTYIFNGFNGFLSLFWGKIVFEAFIKPSSDDIVSASNKAISIEIVRDVRNELLLPQIEKFGPSEFLSRTAKSIICTLCTSMTGGRGRWGFSWGLCSNRFLRAHEFGVSNVLACPPSRNALGLALSVS